MRRRCLSRADEAVAAVFAEKVLAVYRDELEIQKINQSRKDASLTLKTVVYKDMKDYIAMAVAWNRPHLAAWLDIYLDSVATDQRATDIIGPMDRPGRSHEKHRLPAAPPLHPSRCPARPCSSIRWSSCCPSLSVSCSASWRRMLRKMLAPVGDLYLFFIQMSVYPILMSAIVSGLARLIKARSAGGNLLRMAIVFMACMLIVGVFGLLAGLVGEPGRGLDEQAKQILGQLINQNDRNVLELSLSNPSGDPVIHQVDFWNFLRMLVPPNIFQALYQGLALQIVFFSIIFGIALGSVRSEASDLLINIMLSVLETFQRLVAWSLYGLPFALVCLIATQVASVGVEIFAMLKFTVLFWIVGAVLS